MDEERERQPNDIEIIVTNIYGADLHFLAPHEAAVDIFRGISESQGLYTLQIEVNSPIPMESWREEAEFVE